MSRRDYNSQAYNSSDRAEERDEEVVEQHHLGNRQHHLQIVPSADQPLIRTPADEELRELIRQLQHPVKKKVPLIDDLLLDDLPPAA